MWISTSAEAAARSSSASSTIFHAVLRLSVGTRLSFDVIRIFVVCLPGALFADNADEVVQFKCLVDGDQRVKAVRPRRTYIQAEVDLGVRADGGGHTGPL